MSRQRLVTVVLGRHPQFKGFSGEQLRVVKTALAEMAAMSSKTILSPRETDRVFRGLVPDSGKPSAALRAYRKRSGFTQKELSRKCGIPQPHISAMEAGSRTIGLRTAKKLSLALGIDYRKLI
jgi:DNA-binding XRE family transcriptional regulator